MQALKDAGIVLIVITLLVSVRVTKIEPTEPASLMPQVEAAAPAGTEALPAATPTELDRCREMIFHIEESEGADQAFVVVVETEEDGKTKPCPRT